MIASEFVCATEAVQRRQPPAAGSDSIHSATGGQVYERRDGATRSNRATRWDSPGAQPCELISHGQRVGAKDARCETT